MMQDYWEIVTHFGCASLALPLIAAILAGLWQVRQEAALKTWLVALSFAVALTLASKIAFLGWGIGIAPVNFTGISGHTVLATSTLPVLLGWLLVQNPQRFSFVGASSGVVIGAMVGASRVALGAHSTSEVVAAWLIGIGVSSMALLALREPVQRSPLAGVSVAILALAAAMTNPGYLPTHDWEIRMALALSGRDQPYTREQLIARASYRFTLRSGGSGRTLEGLLTTTP